MTQAQAIAALLEVFKANGVSQPPKVAKGKFPQRSKAEWLAAKDKSIVATFKKRGVKDVVLMDRTDKNKPFNVRPFGRKDETGAYNGWLGQAMIVKKGEKSVKGLFHQSQVRPMTDDELAKFAS